VVRDQRLNSGYFHGHTLRPAEIVNACVRGENEVHLGITAKIGAILHGIAPEMLMPKPGNTGSQLRKGSESESADTATPATKLTREAEKTKNRL